MPIREHRRLASEAKAIIELTRRKTEQLKQCVADSRALVAESRALLAQSMPHTRRDDEAAD